MEYFQALFLGIIKVPILFLEGMLIFILMDEENSSTPHKYSLRLFFFISLPLISFFLYLLLGALEHTFRGGLSYLFYIFVLYLLSFCLLYELFFFLLGRKIFQITWNGNLFITFFVVVTGIFYKAEFFHKSLWVTLFFVIGECIGALVFMQATFSLYKKVKERYYGVESLKNPLFAVFLSAIIGLFFFLLETFLS